jgi:uncharacterized glyoxalase superfamily protein PhnB
MSLPGAVPEIPVSDMTAALAYYRDRLGFDVDWGDGDGSIAGLSLGQCRLFLTDQSFRSGRGNAYPVVVWLNLKSNAEVDAQHQEWEARSAMLLSTPEAKPWKLYEFTAVDPDGNAFRVFYDFSRDLQPRN